MVSALDDDDGVDPSARFLRRVDNLDILVQVDANDDGPDMGLNAAITSHLSVDADYFAQVEEFFGDPGSMKVSLVREG